MKISHQFGQILKKCKAFITRGIVCLYKIVQYIWIFEKLTLVTRNMVNSPKAHCEEEIGVCMNGKCKRALKTLKP